MPLVGCLVLPGKTTGLLAIARSTYIPPVLPLGLGPVLFGKREKHLGLFMQFRQEQGSKGWQTRDRFAGSRQHKQQHYSVFVFALLSERCTLVKLHTAGTLVAG